jgi:hypothetical protein
MDDLPDRKTVSVRLEGGLGDHLLGMRVLHFVHERYPSHDIVVYSDCGGAQPQMDIVRMSPLVHRVVPVRQDSQLASSHDMGALHAVLAEDLDLMRSADVFVDAHGALLFVPAAQQLNVPVFQILSSTPHLTIPDDVDEVLAAKLARFGSVPLVAVQFAKYGRWIRQFEDTLRYILTRLVRTSDAIILNIFTTTFEFNHWAEPMRSKRSRRIEEDAEFLSSLCDISERIIPCVDLPITTVASLLRRCQYFIGLDNGIKHLAWALELPRTYFVPQMPDTAFVVRWMPDCHRAIAFGCAAIEVDRQLSQMDAILAGYRG